MKNYEKVYDYLNKMGVAYELVEHPPLFSTEDATAALEFFPKNKTSIGTKSLFVSDKKGKNLFLLIIADDKKADLKELGEILEMKGMRFCSADKLKAKMDLVPGSVSIFGLLNNTEKDITVCLDSSIYQGDEIDFHPNDNTKTLIFDNKYVKAILDDLGFSYREVEV